jgi:hypothetical protein
MTFWTLIRRSLVFRARAHTGVILGAAVGTGALTGALLVGDSVRGTLVQRALSRLGPFHYALHNGDRFFRAGLKPSATAALMLPGTVAKPDGSARANAVNIIGVEAVSWPRLAGWGKPASGSWFGEDGQTACLNEELARQLRVNAGDEILVRVRKPSALSADAVITPKDHNTVALRLRAGTVFGSRMLGDFSLQAHQAAPANLFLPLDVLARATGLPGRANLLLNGPVPTAPGEVGGLNNSLRDHWLPEDLGLFVTNIEQSASATGGESIRPLVEISSSRIFLEDQVIAAAVSPRTNSLSARQEFQEDSAGEVGSAQLVTNNIRILTYLANLISHGERTTPYSMVTAADKVYVPDDMADDEIIVNTWLADDLALKPGDRISLSYYVADSASLLTERTNSFKVRSIVPIKGVYADRTLMPEFPGLAKAESTHDWEAGFPLVHTIRDKDEAYWKTHRGTPKAFITLAAGQKMWASRFGSLTAIRYPASANSPANPLREAAYRNLIANLEPADLGLQYEPVRELALRAASQSQDFGQLFLGFSIFLVAAALLLMALLFQFGVEQRAQETGTLLALGFPRSAVQRLLLAEGVALAVVGGLLGVIGGTLYAKTMLWGLTTIWRNAIGTSALEFHSRASSFVVGFCAAALIAAAVIWIVLRKQARQPARELLTGTPAAQPLPTTRSARNLRAWGLCVSTALPGAGLVAWAIATAETSNAGAFFGAGALLLVSGLSGAAAWLACLQRQSTPRLRSLGSLAVRGAARRRSRSLAVVALLASGTFVVVSLAVFRLDANRDAASRASGTGGFSLIGEATMPVIQDLATEAGRDALGLGSSDVTGVGIVPFRVRRGDEASCLNLNRAQRPRLLGVRPDLLKGRFTVTGAGWDLLKATLDNPEEIPAIGDAASLQWALGLKVGDTLDYADEHGRMFRLRIVAAVANSLLQGSLVLDESQFVKKFPTESGYRMFLVDVPPGSVTRISETLSRALTDAGLELTRAADRLNAFNAVQNTYLGTFQVLGGLGLLLGSAGLGVLVLRNVLERRAELAVLLAVGFRRRPIEGAVLSEHALLLCAGLGLGILAAGIAVVPALLGSATGLPARSLLLTLVAVLVNGAAWTWVATRVATKGNLLAALRNE